jgi:hypothetical protein
MKYKSKIKYIKTPKYFYIKKPILNYDNNDDYIDNILELIIGSTVAGTIAYIVYYLLAPK